MIMELNKYLKDIECVNNFLLYKKINHNEITDILASDHSITYIDNDDDIVVIITENSGIIFDINNNDYIFSHIEFLKFTRIINIREILK